MKMIFVYRSLALDVLYIQYIISISKNFLLHVNTNPSTAKTNIQHTHSIALLQMGGLSQIRFKTPSTFFFQSAMGVATSVTQAEWRQVGISTLFECCRRIDMPAVFLSVQRLLRDFVCFLFIEMKTEMSTFGND